jgi:hypothetical protein
MLPAGLRVEGRQCLPAMKIRASHGHSTTATSTASLSATSPATESITVFQELLTGDKKQDPLQASISMEHHGHRKRRMQGCAAYNYQDRETGCRKGDCFSGWTHVRVVMNGWDCFWKHGEPHDNQLCRFFYYNSCAVCHNGYYRSWSTCYQCSTCSGTEYVSSSCSSTANTACAGCGSAQVSPNSRSSRTLSLFSSNPASTNRNVCTCPGHGTTFNTVL